MGARAFEYKKRRRQRRRFNRKTKYTVAGSVSHLAKRAFQAAMTVKKLINVEHKYYDVAAVATASDYAGVVYTLNNPAQGTTALTRNGDSIKNTHLMVNLQLYPNGANTRPVRIMLIRGNNERATNPTGATVLNVSSTNNTIQSPRNLDYSNIYYCLYDKTFTICNLDSSAITNVEINTPLNHHTHYAAGTANIENGGLYLIIFTDVTGATAPLFHFISRLRFVDN